MSALFTRKGDKHRYLFVDERCIGRKCWSPGLFRHRAPLAGGGSMNTSSPDSPVCMNRAYRGCPEGPEGQRIEFDGELQCEVLHIGLPVFDKNLADERKKEGWRVQ